MSAVSGSETEQALAAQDIKPPLAVPRRLLRMRSDAALAERFALGDEAAFDVIYERHRPVVLAVCMGVLGTPPDAEDATQETFSALAVALRTRPPAELRPWLIRVARNASIDTTRRRRHRLLTLDGEIPEIAARPAGGGQAELAVVLDGIRELPEGQRMALLMRELGGHSYAEIAEFLATDEEAVKGLISRARVGLRTYREATELSCATARNTISAEPDGRRYDKTIRRHLRGCASCRGYRDALRDDAKALRAALPIQAGTVATGSLSSGMLSAAKGSLLGYGLTQAATTCAASACAVGAIGGMVFVAPVHKLGLMPILPSKTAGVQKHATTKKPVHNATAPISHTAVTVSHTAVTAPSTSSAATTDRAALSHGAAALRHRHHVKVTRVSLPMLPRHHRHHPKATNSPATPANPVTTSVTTQTTVVQSVTPVTPVTSTPAQPTQSQTAQSSQSSAGQTTQTGSGQSTQGGSTQGGSTQNGNGNGHGGGSRWGGGSNNGNPLAGATASSGASSGSSTTSTSTTTTPTTTGTTPTTTTPTTTTPTTTTPTSTTPTTTTSPTINPVLGGGHTHNGGSGQSGAHHPGGARQTSTTQSTTSTQSSTTSTQSSTTSTATTSATTTTTPSSTTTTSNSSSSSDGWGQGWGSGSHGNHGWGH
jgi:RNA polymerase sigma factor (sigma-70 family)